MSEGQVLGRLMELAIEDESSAGTFNVIAGVKSNNLTVSTDEVDTTVPNVGDPGLPLQKTALAGLQSWVVSVSGKFIDAPSSRKFFRRATGGNPVEVRLTMPGIYVVQGPMIISDYQFSGDMNETLEFSVTLNANGPIAVSDHSIPVTTSG